MAISTASPSKCPGPPSVEAGKWNFAARRLSKVIILRNRNPPPASINWKLTCCLLYTSLSIGIEEIADLIADLAQALDKAFI